MLGLKSKDSKKRKEGKERYSSPRGKRKIHKILDLKVRDETNSHHCHRRNVKENL